MLKNQKPIKPQAKNTVANDKNANKPKGKKQVEVKSNKWLHLAIAAALAIITIISFSSCFDNELTNWDDPDYILDNPIIRNLDGATVKEIFTKNYLKTMPSSAGQESLPRHFAKLSGHCCRMQKTAG